MVGTFEKLMNLNLLGSVLDSTEAELHRQINCRTSSGHVDSHLIYTTSTQLLGDKALENMEKSR